MTSGDLKRSNGVKDRKQLEEMRQPRKRQEYWKTFWFSDHASDCLSPPAITVTVNKSANQNAGVSILYLLLI